MARTNAQHSSFIWTTNLAPQAASISSLFNLQQTSIKSTKNILRLLFLHGDIYKGMMSYEPSLRLLIKLEAPREIQIVLLQKYFRPSSEGELQAFERISMLSILSENVSHR